MLVPAVWFLPEWWGSGEPFRAGARANAPNPGSAAFDAIPALAVLHRFVSLTIAPVEVALEGPQDDPAQHRVGVAERGVAHELVARQ